MKRWLRIGLTAVLLAVMVVGLLPAGSVFASSMFEYYNTGDTKHVASYGDNYQGQSFTPLVTHTITSVKLKVWRIGSPGTVTVNIRNTDGNGHPTGAVLATGSTNGNNFNGSGPGDFREITLGAGAVVSVDIKYAIEIRVLSGDAENAVCWRGDDDSPTYARGCVETSSDGGVSWSSTETWDLMFEEWGTAVITAPEAHTTAATAIGYNSVDEWFEATLNCYVDDDGGEPCEGDFHYRVVGEEWEGCVLGGTYVTDETFEFTLINLLSETDYEFFGHATNSENDSLNVLSNREFELGTPPTGWSLTGAGASFVRSGEQQFLGEYSGKLTRAGTDCYISQAISGFADYQGDKVTFGSWVYATVADRARLAIYDGVAYGYSDYHSGETGEFGYWQWLDISFDVDGSASELSVRGEVKTGDVSAYFDTCYAVEILEFSTEYVISEPIIVTYGYPLDKYDTSARIYGEVGYDGSSPVEVWFQYRVKDTPPWVDVAVTNMVINGGMEDGTPPTGWALTGDGASWVRSDEQAETGTYSGKLTRAGTDCYAQQEVLEGVRYQSEDVTFGAWVYATVASRARLRVMDGVGDTYSSYHTGATGWEWLTVTHSVDAGAAHLYLQLGLDTGDTSVYYDEAVMVRFGSCASDGEWGVRLETGESADTLITGLAQVTTYEFRLIGENEEGQGFGGIADFKLWGDLEYPEVRTDGTKFIEDTNAWVEGYLVDDGGMPCWVGFEYKEVGESNWKRILAGLLETDEDWSSHLENLSPDTNYDYRAWAWNERCEGTWGGDDLVYGGTKVLYVHETYRTPVVRTRDAEWVDSTTLNLCSTLDYDGGYESDIWFQYRLLGGSLWEETVETLGVTTGYDVERLVFHLETGFWYEFRVVGRNVMGLGYGEILSYKMTASEEEQEEGEEPFVTPVEWIEDFLKGIGMSNEFGHWMIMLVLMVTAFVALHKSEVLRVMIPLLIFGLAMIIGWVEWWFTILLALGAGLTIYGMLRRKMSGGGE